MSVWRALPLTLQAASAFHAPWADTKASTTQPSVCRVLLELRQTRQQVLHAICVKWTLMLQAQVHQRAHRARLANSKKKGDTFSAIRAQMAAPCASITAPMLAMCPTPSVSWVVGGSTAWRRTMAVLTFRAPTVPRARPLDPQTHHMYVIARVLTLVLAADCPTTVRARHVLPLLCVEALRLATNARVCLLST